MTSRFPLLASLLLSGLAGLTSCAITDQADEVTPSGFLDDVSQLRAGVGGEARLVYRAPGLDLSSYRAVLVETVEVWPTIENAAAPKKELERLAVLLRRTLIDRLERDHRVVPNRGEGVLVVRAALTEAAGSNVPLDAATAVIPIARAISVGQKLATGTHAFVGSAAVEAEVLDGGSGERLMAGIDRRVGNKVVRDAFSEWGDVEGAFDAWADQLAKRLRTEGFPPRDP